MTIFDAKDWQRRVDEIADDPIHQLRVSLLNANISWTESEGMTRRTMQAIAKTWNEQHEDKE